MYNASPPFPIDLNQFYLELGQTLQTAEQYYSTAGACQRALINQMCLDTFLDWLRKDISPNARVFPNTAALPSFWEVVNGAAITVENLRCVLIPTLALDGDELSVPQEWVDIPEFVSDYYLAVQVNPDDGWMRVLGYATHLQLKTMGVYNSGDRTYSLESENLIQDLNVLWVARRFYPQECLRADVSPLPALPKEQADNLLQRLGNPDVIFPRLEVPFAFWGALVAHGAWRHSLYEMRQGIAQQNSILEWLQDGLSNFAQQMGWERRKFSVVASGMRNRETSIFGLSRQVKVAGNDYELRVFPKGNPQEQIWRFELGSLVPNNQIPAGFKLRLLTEDLQPFENNEDTAKISVDLLYVEVMLEPGEGLVWEIEPLPEGYDREILRF